MSRWLQTRNNLWTMFAIVALTALLVACTDNNNTQNKETHSPNKKHNVIKQDGNVTFTLGDRQFVIPEGNFKDGTETGGAELVRATLWGLLPDFEGYDKAKNNDEFVKHLQGRGWGRYVQMELYRRTERISIPAMVTRWTGSESLSAISDRVGQYDELRYGLEYYRSKNRSDDIYLYMVGGQPAMFIRCPSENVLKTRPAPSCTYFWDISAGTSYEMWYSMDYLPQWREIWINAKRLLDENK